MKSVEEINKEIRLVKIAIDKTKSDFLKNDYKKHLQRLYRQRDKAVLLNGQREKPLKRR